MVKVNISIGKKQAVLATLFLGIVIGAISVIAYGTTNPAVFGHDAGEIEGVVREGVFLSAPITVYDGTADMSSFFDVSNMVSSPSPPSDVQEVLLKTYLKTDSAFGSTAKFEYWLAISPPMLEQTISQIINSGTSTEESTLTWLPLTDSGTFQYRCSVSGANSRCRVKVYGFR